jgi:hypothetical protein
MTTTGLAEKFASLFDGSRTAHGVYDVSKTTQRSDGKLEGRAATKHEPLTVEKLEAHLAGTGPGVGVVPIRDDNTVKFGAIDIDAYTGLDLRALVNKLQRLAIPLVVCRSKSGGAHLYCFSRTAVPAATMKAKLAEVAGFIGHGDAEIFPKQSQISSTDSGSWISLPYYNGTRGMRYAVDLEGNALSPEAFIIAADSLSVGAEWFNQLLVVSSDFEDGPPCLQALAQVGYPLGTRNEGLFAVGVFLRKSKPDSWESELDSYNHKYMVPPLTTPEVQGLIKSLRRKDYTYNCTKQPIAQHCNSVLCRTRKYGVSGGMNGNFPILGVLTKLNTNPPLWLWVINSTRVELTTQELQDPRAFQRACMNSLNIIPPIPARPVWEAAVQNAMNSVVIIDPPADASPEGQFWNMVERFCTGRAQALALEEITMGKPFTDGGRTYFRLQDLMSFLTRNKFVEFKVQKVSALLRDGRAEHHFANFKGKGTNYWSIPSPEKQTESFDVPKKIGETGDPF